MPVPGQAICDIGDALLQMAPHNVLASLLGGGQVTVIPVMGRQPTMYEEMTRTPALQAEPAPAPAPAAPTVFDAGDDFLRFAPHNVLMALFTGGQLPEVPGMEAPPAGASLAQHSRASGSYEWDPTNMSISLRSGAGVTITAPSDMTLIVTYQEMKRTTKEDRTAGGAISWPQSAMAPLVKMPGSDVTFMPSGRSARLTISPGQSRTISESRKQSISGEERGPLQQVILKRTTTDYATLVTLAGVVPVPKAPKAPVQPKVPTPPTAPFMPPTVAPPPPEVPAGPTLEELQAKAAAEARKKAEEEARQRAILESEAEERRTAEVEARMKAEREQRAVELEERQAKAREELEARIVQRREAEALEDARKEAEQQAQVEAFKKKMEEQRKAQEAAKAERAASVEEISARAAALRQEAARRKLGRT